MRAGCYSRGVRIHVMATTGLHERMVGEGAGFLTIMLTTSSVEPMIYTRYSIGRVANVSPGARTGVLLKVAKLSFEARTERATAEGFLPGWTFSGHCNSSH
jgi:hypothetical protein